MAPRRRPRKIGLKRIDAAVDALLPLGFSKYQICKTVNALLKVYEGDSGWVFIEEASYKLVIEALLEEQEQGLVKKEDSSEDEAGALAATTSKDVAVDATTITYPGTTSTDPGTMGHITETGEKVDWKDISCTTERLAIASTGEDEMGRLIDPREIDSDSRDIQPVRTPQIQRRKPCYGWISDDDADYEEDAQSGSVVPRQTEIVLCISESRRERKRKIRWDVKPSDMM
ncbi:uncharacterized protein LOC143879919 isoform X2 [Tasmannia lanceolata]|uniref:uncharacterized protein LOC143879919 isoform X2 n=1 Tax=Tasmannia lanceolata TaxID=3420 RepID=UPI00406419FF